MELISLNIFGVFKYIAITIIIAQSVPTLDSVTLQIALESFT